MPKLHTVTLSRQDQARRPANKRRPATALLISVTLHLLAVITLWLIPRTAPPLPAAPTAPQFTLHFPTDETEPLLTDSPPSLRETLNPAPSIQAHSAPPAHHPATSQLTRTLSEISIDVTFTPSEKVASPVELTDSSLDLPAAKNKTTRKKASTATHSGNIASAKILKRRAPIYPKLARKKGYQGTSIFIATINPDGSIKELKLSKTSGHAMLDRAAKEALRHWRFTPAKRNGITIASQLRIPIAFRLG